jgi:hypothetical protein
VEFEAIRTVCMDSYVSPAAALLVEGGTWVDRPAS